VFRKWSSGEGTLSVLNELVAAGMLAQVAELNDQPSPESDAVDSGDPSSMDLVPPEVDQNASGSDAVISPELSQAMDNLLLLRYFLAGTTPKAIAEKRRKAAKEIKRQREAKSRAVAEAWATEQTGK